MDRAAGPVDLQQRVALQGNVHPLARAEFDIGAAPAGQRMERMILVLKPDGQQQAALEALLEAQQDPESPYYHRWLTPEEFGRSFGVSDNDLRAVERWLQGHGLAVEEIPAGRTALIFSGTAAQVEAAFHTPIRNYFAHGQAHYANAGNPEVPRALAGVVGGVVSLHDFRSAPAHVAAPAFTAGNGAHFLAPQDWVTIYDVGPLYGQGIDGTGQSIAVLGRADISLTDVRTFRGISALAPNDPQIIVNGPNPGLPDCGDEVESTLDVEWAGAIARNATVKFVTSQSGVSDGVALSAQYAVTNRVAPIVTLSYGLCEGASGSSGNAFWNALWSQAASYGMSVFVSSGDSGAAGCDDPSLATATQGRGVNALCSSPYSTCVGGTMFDDGYNPNLYWSAANGTGMASAIGYIPELPWNESGWSGGLWAGGGGASIAYAKPAWQAAPGVPADGVRDVPDVSMTAAIHDAYLIEFQNGLWSVAGTSAAAPSLASVIALVLQNAGTPLGNVNPALYALATRQYSGGGAAVFHDIASGNNGVPGVTGFNAGTGYDLATGLGSVDANLLVNHWSDASAVNFALAASPSSLTVAQAKSGTASLALTRQGGFNSAVTLSASGAPAGVTVTFSSATLTTAPVTVTIAASSNAAAGSYALTLTGTGGGLTRTARLALTVTAATFTLTPSATSTTVVAGGTAAITLSTAAASGFNSAVALSASGLPAGVTAKFAPASIAAPGTGSSTLTFTAASTAAAGVYAVTVTATGGGVTKTQPLTLTVVQPSFTLTTSLANASLTPNSSVKGTVSTVGVNGFKSAIALSIGGLPAGVTASLAPKSIAAPGTGSITLTVTAGSAPANGAYNLVITASGGGVTKTSLLVLTVSAPSFTLTLGGSRVGLNKGGSLPITVSTAATGGFSSAIALSIGGLPTGATGKFAPTSIAKLGTGSSSLTLAAASTAKSGTYSLTVTATGGGLTKTQPLTLIVN